MTRLIVAVGDDTLEGLQAQADSTRRPLEEVAAQYLKRAVPLLPIGGRALVISGHELELLEGLLGLGSLLNDKDLLKKVERLAGISFLHCRLPFTPNQLEALKEKADRQGLTVEQLVERAAPRIYEQFFDLVARV